MVSEESLSLPGVRDLIVIQPLLALCVCRSTSSLFADIASENMNMMNLSGPTMYRWK